MVPLLAASSALGVAGSVVSAVQKLTSSKGSAAADDAGGAGSFSAMLASQGVVPQGAGGTASVPGPTARHGQHGGSRHVDTLA